MALLSAYATPPECRARWDTQSQADDVLLGSVALAASRALDYHCGLHPGALNSHTATYVFDGRGGTELRLRDRAGHQYLLQSVTADSLKLDTDFSGVHDNYLWDLADLWVRGLPENAAGHSDPFTSLELRTVTGAPLGAWPTGAGVVQIAGTWGCSAASSMLDVAKTVVILVTRSLLDTHRAGETLQLQDVDSAVQVNPGARSLKSLLERGLAHAIPGFA